MPYRTSSKGERREHLDVQISERLKNRSSHQSVFFSISEFFSACWICCRILTIYKLVWLSKATVSYMLWTILLAIALRTDSSDCPDPTIEHSWHLGIMRFFIASCGGSEFLFLFQWPFLKPAEAWLDLSRSGCSALKRHARVCRLFSLTMLRHNHSPWPGTSRPARWHDSVYPRKSFRSGME